MFITEFLMMAKVPPNLNVQQIGEGYLKYVFKKKASLQILKMVRGEILITGKCLKHKVKRARYTKCVQYV